MKHSALILTALLVLTACQKKAETTQQTQTPATETPATETPENDTPETTTPSAQTPSTPSTDAAASQPGELPAGYTLVPFLTEKPKREFTAEPDMALQDGKDYYALIDTSKGQILADLYEQETPVTVNNFVTLARNHFFDGIRFHRVIDDFMAQTGDPLSVDETKKAEWGTGGPGYSFADEFRQKLTFNGAGILAMANSGPATNGSQFFITFNATEHLNGKHSIFGKVVKGEEVLPKITRTSDANGVEVPDPKTDQILTVRILTKN